MNPAKVRREAVRALTDLPNIGPACAKDLRLLGIEHPEQLVGRDAWDMYEAQVTPCRRRTWVMPDPWMHYLGGRMAQAWANQESRLVGSLGE